MEGIYFYWIVWIGWVYSTFLLEKTNKRIEMTIFLLLLIIFSTKQVTVFTLTFNSAIIFCLFCGCLILSERSWKRILYYLSVSLILTSSFVTFKLFQLYDPVWLMFNPTVKLSVILLLLILLLVREQRSRVGLLFITIAQGEVLHQLFLKNLVADVPFSQFDTLDVIAITIGMSFIWFGFEKFVKWLEIYTKQKSAVFGLNGQ